MSCVVCVGAIEIVSASSTYARGNGGSLVEESVNGKRDADVDKQTA
jgi:hypothetical protein